MQSDPVEVLTLGGSETMQNRMIIDPNRITKNSIPAPDEQTLKGLINQTYEAIGTLQRLIRENKEATQFPYLNDFLRDSLITNSDILLSISTLSSIFLNSTLILMRTYLETMIDFLWVYSIFLEEHENGDNLAKRFYQIGAVYFLSMSDRLEGISRNDPFVVKAKDKINISQDTQRAKDLNLIELIDKQAGKHLQGIQKTNWRALPGLIQNTKQIQFEARSKKAADLASKLFNLKAAPYQHNWKLLNAFAHWSSLHYKDVDDSVATALYERNLNVMLGFLHDMIYVCYDFIGRNVPERLRVIERQFIYFST